jgi:lipopolysaccharide export system protein LptA
MKKTLLFAIVCLLILACSARADEEGNGRVLITADSTTMETNGTFVLTGNVKLTSMGVFGTANNKITNVSVRADKAIVYQDQSTHDIGKIEAFGKVLIRTSQGTISGNKLVYNAQQDTFRMTGEPVLRDFKGNTASGSAITWDNRHRKLSLEEGARISLNVRGGKMHLPNIKEEK